MSGMTLRELMACDIFQSAKYITYVDRNRLPIETKKLIEIATVLLREEQKDGSLLVMLWVENKMPDGWKKIEGAMTAPIGFMWIYNGKSIFDESYKCALMRCLTYDLEEDA